jgi:hypothetical protein
MPVLVLLVHRLGVLRVVPGQSRWSLVVLRTRESYIVTQHADET